MTPAAKMALVYNKVKRLFRRREREYILQLEKELMISQQQVDDYTARVNAATTKIEDLESRLNAAAKKAIEDAQTITNLQAKVDAIPPAVPDVDASGLETAIAAQEQALIPVPGT